MKERPPRRTAYNIYNVEKQRAGTEAEDVGEGSRFVKTMENFLVLLILIVLNKFPFKDYSGYLTTYPSYGKHKGLPLVR